MTDCIFCKIVAGEIPSRKAYEDDMVLAFHDISPVAPVHILVIPKEHIKSAASLGQQHAELLGQIFAVIAKLADEFGLSEGFRVVSNAGEMAGQTVSHLHFHLLGGRLLTWPPG